MQLITTAEGYPALLKTRTRVPKGGFFESDLTHGNRTTPWVYLTQNPRGRWQVLVPDPFHAGDVLCIAGGQNAAQVLPVMVGYAYDHDILKRGSPKTMHALWSLGSFVTRAHQAAANAAR